MDLDWEYPAQRNGTAEDKPLFSKLCQEMKVEFEALGLILSAAVAGGQKNVDISYEVAEISKHLDFLNIMSYDLHGSWEETTAHHTDTDPNKDSSGLSVYNSIDYWIKKGADPKKIVLGLATYGRTWQLSNPCNWQLGSKTKKIGGAKGKYTGERGLLAYYEICKMNFQNRVCTKSSSVHAPYGTDGRDFVAYDDEESIAHKVAQLAKAKQLKGVMYWALDFDDFNGICGKGKYPLLKSAMNALYGFSQTFTSCQNSDRPCGSTGTSGGTGPVPSVPYDPDNFDTGDYIRVCYVTNWSQYRKGTGKYDITKHYQKGMCTHVIFAFAKVVNKVTRFPIEPYEWNDHSTGYKQVRIVLYFQKYFIAQTFKEMMYISNASDFRQPRNQRQ